mgnify:CR=1 FL=1
MNELKPENLETNHVPICLVCIIDVSGSMGLILHCNIKWYYVSPVVFNNLQSMFVNYVNDNYTFSTFHSSSSV